MAPTGKTVVGYYLSEDKIREWDCDGMEWIYIGGLGGEQ